MRVRGVGAFSATESCEGAWRAAESIRTAFSNGPTRPLQVAAASLLILEAAPAGENDIVAASAAKAAHARASFDKLCIISSSLFFAHASQWRCVNQQAYSMRGQS
jgi:hypothetical protein